MFSVFFDTHICVSHDDNVIHEGKEEKQNRTEHREESKVDGIKGLRHQHPPLSLLPGLWTCWWGWWCRCMCRKFFSRQRKRRPLDSDSWRWWRGDRENSENWEDSAVQQRKERATTTITVPPLRMLCSLHRVQSPLIIHTRCVKESQTELTVLLSFEGLFWQQEGKSTKYMNVSISLSFILENCVLSEFSENLLLLSNIKWFMCVTRFQDFIVELCRTFVFQSVSFIFTKAKRNQMVLSFDSAGATYQSMEREKSMFGLLPFEKDVDRYAIVHSE